MTPPLVGNIDILLQNTRPGTSSLKTFINKVSQCNYTGLQENSSSKLTCKLFKVWATDSKSVFSFSPAHMVFEMRQGYGYFHVKMGLKILIYLYNILMIFL
jgi:hypothetical protein